MSPPRAADDDRRFWRALRRERAAGDRREEPAPDAPGADVPEAGAGGADGAAASAASPDWPESITSEEEIERHRDEARRLALRTMLDAAEARHERASRARRPVLASGAVVRVTRGEFAGRTGIVVDADYIESRVLLNLDPDEPPHWVPFRRVGPAESDG